MSRQTVEKYRKVCRLAVDQAGTPEGKTAAEIKQKLEQKHPGIDIIASRYDAKEKADHEAKTAGSAPPWGNQWPPPPGTFSKVVREAFVRQEPTAWSSFKEQAFSWGARQIDEMLASLLNDLEDEPVRHAGARPSTAPSTAPGGPSRPSGGAQPPPPTPASYIAMAKVEDLLNEEISGEIEIVATTDGDCVHLDLEIPVEVWKRIRRAPKVFVKWVSEQVDELDGDDFEEEDEGEE